MSGASGSAFGLTRIGQIAVPVSDIGRAVGFYRDVLGMRFLFQAPPDLAFFDCGGVRLMLDGPAKVQAGTSSVIYYSVEDLGAAFRTLSRTGESGSRRSRTSLPGCRTTSSGWPSCGTPTEISWP